MYLYRVILQYYLRYNQRAIDVRFTLHKSQVAHQTGYKTFFFNNHFNLQQNTMLQTLLTMQVSLCYSILTLLTIRVTYAGNTLLNTVTENTVTCNTVYLHH